MVIWASIAGFLVVGYLTMGRSFAYLGIPPFFVGEIALAAFLLLKPRVAFGTWAASVLGASPLNRLGLALLVFMLYGIWQVARGVLSGSSVVHTLKFFVFNYYAIYIFLGLWIGLQSPHLLPKLTRVLAWVNGIYGLTYVVALQHLDIYRPGFDAHDVPLFSPPAGQVVAILGLLCFERNLRAVWFLLVINIMVTLMWQVRADWAGLALGVIAWGLLTGRLGRVAAIGVAGLAMLGMVALADINLAGRRGYEVSLSETLARAIAPIDLELAKELSPIAEVHAGTAEWRQTWWDAIWRSVHSRPTLAAFGHGYGFPLISVAPEEAQDDNEADRTPHSVFFYALGYTGWVGVTLFGALQFAIVKLLWRSYRVCGQPAGLVYWVVAIAGAMFKGAFEAPQVAIPVYLLLGMSIAPGLLAGRAWNSRGALFRVPFISGGSGTMCSQPVPPKRQ